MAAKHTYHQDPEYEAIPASYQEKRIKLMEDSGRMQTKKKIEGIITTNFNQEVNSKGAELDCLDEYLYDARSTLDRLRACAITKYYANVGQEQTSSSSENVFPSIHPTSKKYLGKSPKYANNDPFEGSSSNPDGQASTSEALSSCQMPISNHFTNKVEGVKSYLSPSIDISSRAPRIKVKIIIGNISKFIPVWMRDESDQHITHKWMIYVRGDKSGPSIESFVKKVRFFLHSSYRPNDIVEICSPPFHLIKRGWGEFEVRVQIFFHDPRNKPVDIQHTLKLDKTFTGLQTLGNETVVDLQLFKTDISGSHLPASVSTIPSISSLPSSHNSQQSHVSCNELNSNSTITNRTEPDIESETTVDVSNTDDVVSSLSAQNISHKKVPNESNFDDASNSSLPNGNLSDADIPNRTTISKPAVPMTIPSKNADSGAKPVNNCVPNGVNTTYLKCRDKEGRVLLVPQSSLVCVKSRKLPVKTSVTQTNPDKVVNSKTSVPSYFLTVVPNQDSGQNKVLLIPMADKKVQSTDSKTSAEVDCQSGPTSFGMLNGNSDADSSQKLKPSIFWEEDLSNIKIEYYKSFVDLLKRVCKAIPLVKENVDRSLYPFCASSLHEFLRWTIGKQRACEWKRAGLVRTAVLNIIKKNKFPYATEDSVWPRHVIMTWCRKNGFVPMSSEKMTLLPEPKWSGVELCSVSSASELLSSLLEDGSKSDSVEEDLEIDIVGDTKEEDSWPSQKSQSHLPHTHVSHIHPAAAFVKDLASQVGVNIRPIELEPSVCIPTIEEIILAACRELAADIIRSSVSAGYNRMGGQLCPEEITVSDVYTAIKDTPRFDFLTNSHLGVPKESNGDT